jgi:hypothetical protein
MQRMRSIIVKLALKLAPVLVFLIVTGVWGPARGDLIRPKAVRTYPDIAGDIVGSQTYTFDPASKTGTFQVTNSPQVIALGPTGSDMMKVSPDQEGTLSQTLQLRLNQNGQIVDNPENRFQLYGSVVIGNQVYQGLLLEGTPTAFGVETEARQSLSGADVFDLNVKITGGQLAAAFGPEAYFRVIPQSNSTFQGSFAASFSSEKPLTNLRALQGHLPSPIPEPSPLVVLLTAGAGVLVCRLWKSLRPPRGTRPVRVNQPATKPTACRVPRSRSGALVPGSGRATRQSP